MTARTCALTLCRATDHDWLMIWKIASGGSEGNLLKAMSVHAKNLGCLVSKNLPTATCNPWEAPVEGHQKAHRFRDGNKE